MSLRRPPRLSPAALDANRRNSLKSTGPRTPEGKRRVRLNARKHGLRSRRFAETVVSSAEDSARFERGLVLLRLAFVPAGAGAARLVEQASRMMWTRGRNARPGGRQPYFSLTRTERVLLAQVANVCEWWYVDEATYEDLPTKPECPLESTDSFAIRTLFLFQLPADPALVRRVGKRMAKAVYRFAQSLVMYEAYQQSQNVL